MKEHSLYDNNNNFLRKISHSDGTMRSIESVGDRTMRSIESVGDRTWTNFGKVIALDSILHIFLLFSFLILFSP